MPDPSENQIYRISNDDNRYIYNGIPDWIYEEEILATGTAFWWSIDGTRLAYARFNDSEVEIQEYPWYGDQVDTETQYLAPIKIKYPKVREILFIILCRKDKTSVYCISHIIKPGTTNPTITLHTVDLEKFNSISYEVLPPFEITKQRFVVRCV